MTSKALFTLMSLMLATPKQTNTQNDNNKKKQTNKNRAPLCVDGQIDFLQNTGFSVGAMTWFVNKWKASSGPLVLRYRPHNDRRSVCSSLPQTSDLPGLPACPPAKTGLWNPDLKTTYQTNGQQPLYTQLPAQSESISIVCVCMGAPMPAFPANKVTLRGLFHCDKYVLLWNNHTGEFELRRSWMLSLWLTFRAVATKPQRNTCTANSKSGVQFSETAQSGLSFNLFNRY